jgi:hypothetical protein
MLKRIKELLKTERPIILYPVLLLLVFILKKNQIHLADIEWYKIVLFFIANVALLFMLFAILNIIIKNRFKTWIIVAFVLTIFLFFGRISQLINNFPFVNRFSHISSIYSKYINLAYLIIIVTIISYSIIKYRGSLIKFTQYLNLLLGCLMVYQLFTMFTQNTKRIVLANTIDIGSIHQQKVNNNLPDIYYIIFDAYTSSQSLKNYWGYRNDTLTAFLKGKGFFIANESNTNYNQTENSICSSLNMSYLENVTHTFLKPPQALNLINLLKESQVVKILIKNGYRVENYSFFDIPNHPKFFPYPYFPNPDLLIGTIYEPIIRKLNKDRIANQNTGTSSWKVTNLAIINKLKDKNMNHKNPLFVYAHLMMPHSPYFFNENGKIQEDDSAYDDFSKSRYLGQLKYVNKLIETTINTLIHNNSERLPVIIIQGDHGWRFLAGPNQFKESITIFNAYFFPDNDYRNIFPSISPVNTFRVIFNKYMGYKLPLLKDTANNVFVY